MQLVNNFGLFGSSAISVIFFAEVIEYALRHGSDLPHRVIASSIGIVFGSLPSGSNWLLMLLGVAFLSFVGQNMLNFGAQRCHSSVVAVVRTFDVVFALGYEWLVFGEIPSTMKTQGVALVVAGAVLKATIGAIRSSEEIASS